MFLINLLTNTYYIKNFQLLIKKNKPAKKFKN